jgi:hypothetical protein
MHRMLVDGTPFIDAGRSPLDPCVQVLELALKAGLVVLLLISKNACRGRSTLTWWRSAVNRSLRLGID